MTRSLLDPGTREKLLREAHARCSEADEQVSHSDDLCDWRGGQPARRLWTSPGGPVQDASYRDARVLQRLTKLVGRKVRIAGERGSYSYYVGGTQFLALHRDVVTCDITTITVLSDTSSPDDRRGGLLCYPNRCHEPMSAIRATPRQGARILKAPANTSIVIAGGEVAHRLLPLAEGAERIVSVLCFEVLGAP